LSGVKEAAAVPGLEKLSIVNPLIALLHVV
jgi:hypothetical protein